MANKMRYRWGETKPRIFAVDSAEVIEIGDLVWLNTDDVRPAADLTNYGSLISNQDEFKQVFAGVAAQHSASGETDPIRVDTAGVFAFTCASATFEVGDLIGPDDAGDSGAALLSQQVIAVAVKTAAIGVVAQREAVAVTEVLVDIISTVATGGGMSEQTVGSGA
ncbi:MAG TPA: hypothetical protein VMY42_08585 [Thermoguttaceae bacterium]|nr:hypothetical protein [Thermoguttaceae bacterium]